MTDQVDFLIVGGGIAGAGLGAELAKRGRVLVIEMEGQPGYHATGRSVAFWTETYGGPLIQPLTAASGRLSYGDREMNENEHAVYKNGESVHLTKKEYEILRLLMANRGKVMTKEDIFAAIWGDRVHLEEGILAVHVKAIRGKLGGRYIENVRGIGYLLPKECPADGPCA